MRSVPAHLASSWGVSSISRFCVTVMSSPTGPQNMSQSGFVPPRGCVVVATVSAVQVSSFSSDCAGVVVNPSVSSAAVSVVMSVFTGLV